MEARDRFSTAADDYARYRPGYPDELALAVAEYAGLEPGSRVVDIGCGTGISSRCFAAHGFRVTGVEPNRAMLERARADGQAEYLEGEAVHTGLPDACADAITCAQALHWFDLADCQAEWRRILRPGGACAAFWNFRRADGWQTEYERLLLDWSDEYAEVRKARDGGNDYGAWVRDSASCEGIVEHEFANTQRMDLEALLGRASSSSYVIHGVRDRVGFENELRALFARWAEDGTVEFCYRTYLLMWRFR